MYKRLSLILAGCFMCLALAAQKKTLLDSLISIEFKAESLTQCIHKLENTGHLLFTFSASDLEAENKTFTAAFSNKPVSQVLDAVLKNTHLSYKYLGGQVVIFKKKEVFTISGFIKDAQSGEVLIGASVFLKDPLLGTSSNAYGFYSLTLPKNNYDLFATFISQEKKIGTVSLKSDTTINVLLSTGVELNEIEVKAPEVKDKVSDPLTVDRVNIEAVKKIPAPFGEPDILRNIQMLPGIQTTGEASLAYYVRGGSFCQNLVLLDDAPVYNPTHLLGIVSAFNTDMVKSVDFYKGGIPSGYQSGASSVMDIRTRDGNDKRFGMGGGISPLSCKLFVEGPIKKEKCSFFLAGRKTLITDYFYKTANYLSKHQRTLDGFSLRAGFYDLNMKVNYVFNDRNRLYISAYSGKDYLRYDVNGTDWKNNTFTLRYNHIYNGKLFSNASLIYSRFKVSNTLEDNDTSGIFTEQYVENRIGKFVLSYFPRPGTLFNGGLYLNHQVYSPFSTHITTPGIDTTIEFTTQRTAIEAALFLEAQHSVTKRISFNLGLRAPFFRDNTTKTVYSYHNSGNANYVDSLEIRPATFKALEPRANLNFLLRPDQSLKFSYNHINQFQQQFQGGSLFNLVQVWQPSSSVLKPQTVDQLSMGYFLRKKRILYSLETFYKHIDHVSDFINGSQFIGSNFLFDIETLLRDGSARSYGLELSARKTEGKLTGWLNYTLAKTMYKIAAINEGKSYPASFDNRHTISLGLIFEISKKWEFSSLFNYRSGRAISFPDSYYEINGKYYNIVTERNKERTPSYHRLDISFIYKPQTRNKRFSSTWIFSLMNVYNKFNPTYYDIEGRDVTGYTLFPIFPSVAYNFKF